MIENAKKFLEELDANEKAQELLKAAGISDSADEAATLAQAARETGYEVSDDEMGEFLAKVARQRAAASDAVADTIRELSPDELDLVAGGKGSSTCLDTYLDDENCWFYDNCKKVNNIYWDEEAGPVDCESYTFCAGFYYKADCEYGRVGF